MRFFYKCWIAVLLIAALSFFLTLGLFLLGAFAFIYLLLKCISWLPLKSSGKGTIVTSGQVVDVDYYEVNEKQRPENKQHKKE